MGFLVRKLLLKKIDEGYDIVTGWRYDRQDPFLSRKLPSKIANKIILSGGISISNIKRIIDEVNPYAVDLSSSVEEYPGKKSELKLKQFFNILKGKN